MKDKEKLIKIKSLADNMYYAAFNMTTDASLLRRAMDDYHQFLIYEYHKEEPVSEDLEEAAYHNCIDRLSNESIEDFKAGAKWQEKQDQSTIELAEDHAYFAGSEAMREKILKEIEEAYKKGGVIEAMKIIQELKK